MIKTLPEIAIVGRSNVGKSTLFNRIIGKPKALVSSVAGTTRDRNIADAEWNGRTFTLIDTGGLDIDLNEETHQDIAKGIIEQAKSAITRADVIMFVIDATAGATQFDKDLLKELAKTGDRKKIIFVANKSETARADRYDQSIYRLGLGEPMFVSASSGSGIGDLLDEVVDRLPKAKKIKELDIPTIKIALVGKPNVGKSSILNSILGEDRVIVSSVAHTTRESHDSTFLYKDHKFIIVDTAGIRKQARVERGLEKKSVAKSLDAIKHCDVAVLVTEANKKIDAQDKKITQAILESGRSVIIVANKWDLVPDKETNTVNQFTEYYRNEFPYLWWAPLLFISAKDNLRSKKILDSIIDIIASRHIQLSDSMLDKFLKSKIKKHRPSRGKGLKNPYIYEIKQEAVNPPRFIVFVNDPLTLHFSYIRFLQNSLRDQFKIVGTPIQVELRKWKGDQPNKPRVAKAKKHGKGKATRR